MVKKLALFFCLLFTLHSIGQDSTVTQREQKNSRKTEKRDRRNAIIKQEEEGVLDYHRQSTFGIQLRTNGYGIMYELGRSKSPRFTNLYLIELSEIKHPKEEKQQTSTGIFSNSFVYGKINNFYQLKLGFGQQYILGQKGNKNGIAVMGIYQGGLALGLLRPYYLNVMDDTKDRDIKYDSPDSLIFLTGTINGSSGISKGWNEIKLKPGAFIKTALRFDFGRYNESVNALEIGVSLDTYSQKIPIMAPRGSSGEEAVKPKQLFFQAHIAVLFGRRK
ncbi:MAG: hypothetical protein WKF70_02150 [Chitinophagaceae bacterium]